MPLPHHHREPGRMRREGALRESSRWVPQAEAAVSAQPAVLGRETRAPPLRTGGRGHLTPVCCASPGPEVMEHWRMRESRLGAMTLSSSSRPTWQRGKNMSNSASAWLWWGHLQVPELSEPQFSHL